MSNRAWVTLATNDSYGLGALVLAHSLRRAGSTYPTVVLITPSVTDAMRDRLSAVFTEVISVDVLDSRDATHLALLQRPELGITFTKIHCWSLTQYEKCVFLDADTLVIQNCDELFEREELSAAPDVGWPDCFNSGVFVFQPSADTYSRLITFAQERGSFDGGDQGLLNSFFSDWAHGDINKHLPFLYNVTSAAFYSYLPALKHFGQNLKIIHFIGAAKPWLQQFNWESRTVEAPGHVQGLLQQWWDLFVGQVHSQLNVEMDAGVTVEEEEAPPPIPPQDVQFHYAPKLDPESEFPWHHPEAQTLQAEVQAQIDMTQFYDPWENYRGNIPPMADHQSTQHKFGEAEDLRQLRQYAWDYQSSHMNNVTAYDEKHIWHQSQQHYEQHYSQEYQHQHQGQFHTQYQKHSEHTEHNWEDRSHHENIDHNQDHEWHQDFQSSSHNSHDHFERIHEHPISFHRHYEQTIDYNDHEQPRHSPDHHHPQSNHSHHHHHDHSIHSEHDHVSHSLQNISEKQEPHNTFDHSQHHHERNDIHYHDPKHVESHSVSVDHLQKPYEHSFHQYHEHMHLDPYGIQPKRVEHVFQVQLDHKRNRRRREKIRIITCTDKMINGDVSDTESEDDEYIIPRHPYDGFYLRHRPTIDPRGRKICSHEIPPTPSPSPPPEPSNMLASDSTSTEDFLTASECEEQTGVAGNLARVVPGSIGYQREALDELTRRQGWEAGNIDYMGADSFDNIWAKISQTLSQPKQPSPPPKEPSPPKQTEVKEAPTEAPAPVEAAEKTEAPAPVAPAPVEAPAPAPVEPAVTESVPVQTAAPVVVAQETATVPEAPKKVVEKKTEPVVPPTPPTSPKSSPEDSTPVTPESLPKVESPLGAKKTAAIAPASPATPEPAKPEVTPEKPLESSTATAASTDSPPLANTPSKEQAPVAPAAKSEERRNRKPAGKLQLSPPAPADPLPTPDSELEDAASLAQSIIASELSTSVTSPSPPADVTSPLPLPVIQDERLSVEKPEVPTPPVSLAQIGVKPKAKASTAAQIESSVSEKAEPTPGTPDTPTTPSEPSTPTEAPKKKVVKKASKKEGGSSGDATTPVPPPRKKEKKPK